MVEGGKRELAAILMQLNTINHQAKGPSEATNAALR